MILRLFSALFAAMVLAACSPDKPIKIGFIGGLSDRTSDTGEAGRNGLMLAVEQRNLAGGIHGRTIEIVVQDDDQNSEKAIGAINALVAAQVDAVIGPFTSSVAAAVVPVTDRARLAMISPTVSSVDFLGKDDYLIRINSTTRANTQAYAQTLYRLGRRRVAVAYDTHNLSFSASWLAEFTKAFTAIGGELAVGIPFASQVDTDFGNVVRQMLAAGPDGLVFVASAVDVARLAQQAKKIAPNLPKSAAEWAASETLLELGGTAVDGLIILQSYNRDDPSERYQAFRSAYLARFGREPGYSSVASYDASTVLLQALTKQAPGESVKEAVLKHGPYEGLQQIINFDGFGDTTRKNYFSVVQAGNFVLIQ